MSELQDLLAGADDLGAWSAALVREKTIRNVMAETGESRKIVTEVADAAESMDQEAVLSLTEGKPTTLADALGRYVDGIRQRPFLNFGDQNDEVAGTWEEVEADLNALLAYPWPSS